MKSATTRFAAKATILFFGATFMISCAKKQHCPAYSGAYKYKKKASWAAVEKAPATATEKISS